MKFGNLLIQNFMSIKKISLELDNQGLVLINGDNRDEDNLKSNGAGKTNLIESIVWVLYGKTLKGVKADEVINTRAKKDTMVQLAIEDDDGSNYIISRYRKHKEFSNAVIIFKGDYNITPKSDKDTNDLITSILQMDYMTFVSTILFSSKSFKFTSATDSEMKKSFDTMLDFDILNRCQEIAKNEKSELNKEIERLLNKISKVSEDAENARGHLEKLKEEKESQDKQNKQRLKELKVQLDERNQNLKEHLKNAPKTGSSKVTKELETYKKKKQEVQSQIDEFDELQDNLAEVKAALKTNSASVESNIREIQKLKKKLQGYQEKIDDKNSMLGDFCPVCGAEVTEEGLDNVLQEVKQEITNIKEKIKEYKQENKDTEENSVTLQELLTKIEEQLEERTTLAEQRDEINGKIQEIQAEQKQYSKMLEQHDKLTEQYKKSIKDTERAIEDCKSSSVKTFDTLINDCIKQVEGYEKQEEQLTEELESIENKLPALDLWVEGFGNQGIKSFMLDDVTPFLNERVNYYIQKLASNIEIIFSTQDTLKSGEKRDKFNIQIINTSGGNKYISNSGGEQKRIDISVNLALQDLVASRSNKRINLAFYDECFDAVDDIGVERIVELLQENINNKSSIYVTSHNETLKAFFDKSICIVKKDGYSSIKKE